MVKEIILYGNELLRKGSKEITDIYKNKEKLQSLIDTLNDKNEFALAAPQIGYNIRAFIIRPIWLEIKNPSPILFINPHLEEFKGLQNKIEGCLSIPGIQKKVKRPYYIKFKSQNFKGIWNDYEAKGLFARTVQHENDHLDGILFIDKLSDLERKTINGKLNKIKKSKN